MSMESHIYSLGFPLGFALLLITTVIFSGIFSCCYHNRKLRLFLCCGSHPIDLEAATHAFKRKPTLTGLNEMHKGTLPVLMPGDEVPKFIAMPCPRQPLRSENDDVHVEVQKLPKLSPHAVVPLC